MSLRICYIIDILESSYPRDQNYIIRYMSERGHEVTVLTSMDERFISYDKVFFPRARIIRAPKIFSIGKTQIFIHPYILVKIFRDCDVVHTFTFFTFSSLLGVIQRSHLKIIRSEIGPPNGYNFEKSRRMLYKSLIKLYNNVYDYFTVYNNLEAKSLVDLRIPKERILILPPPIDYYEFSKYTRRINEDEISIGFIGRISPEKGVHRLINILRYLRHHSNLKFRFVLAGRIDDTNYANIVLRYLRNILGERLIYMGEVAPPFNFYRAVDVVIIPSLMETGAITVLEAMAAGKIVVASNIYPINLYIINSINGFLFNNEMEAAKIVNEIVSGIFDLRSIAKNAQQYAKKHDYRSICAKLELVYHHGLQ